MTRLLTAAILIPIVLYAVFVGPWWLLLAVVAAFASLSFIEYCGICEVNRAPLALGLVGGLSLLAAPLAESLAILTLLALLALLLPLRGDDLRRDLNASLALVAGVVYIFGAMKSAYLLGQLNPYWLFFPLVVSWLGDTGAYYVGGRFGKHKLAPRVSPGKSWEGAVASGALSVIFAVLVMPRLIPGLSVSQAALLGIVVNIAGQAGDLAESALKRAAGKKDSGSLLPGHGGMLDRIDSALFAIPVTYVLITRLAIA